MTASLSTSKTESKQQLPLEELKEIYKGTSLEDKCEILFKKPKDKEDLYKNFLSSKLWRLNNLYYVINKQGILVLFVMTRAQHVTYAAYLRHPRLIILKSRQQGISTLWLVFFFDTLLVYGFKKGGLMSQGIDESAELLDKLTILWQNLDPDIKEALKLTLVKNNSTLFELSNGSKMMVRTSFRSGTLQMLHISEMGKIANKYPARATEVKTGSLQALAPGLPGIVESTAEGVNEFKFMWDTAVSYQASGKKLAPKDFYPLFLAWTDDPDCLLSEDQERTKEGMDYFDNLEKEFGITCSREQKNFWEAQFRELGTNTYQEYPATPEEAFRAALEGAYYGSYTAKYIIRGEGRIRENLYDPSLPIFVSMDLGLDDDFVLFFWQYWQGEHRLIREYMNNDEVTEHYVEIVKYYYPETSIAHLIMPHDASQRDFNSKKSRYDIFKKAFRGTRITVLQKTPSIIDDINETRKLIPKLVLDKNCTYALECLQNYSKQYDEKRQVFLPAPRHDEFSHGADCLRYYAIGNKAELMNKKIKAKKLRGHRNHGQYSGHEV